MPPKTIQLKPIKETTEDYEAIETKLDAWFRAEIYLPILQELGESKTTLSNSSDALLDAIKFGRITFHQGRFTGKFNASVSKELKELGATWDRKTGAWKILLSSLPPDFEQAVRAQEQRFVRKLQAIDRKLAQILPEEITGKLQVEQLFDRSLWKVDKEFRKTVENITVAPQLTDAARKRIADEWQTNMRLWVKDFTESEITKLRKGIQKSAFAGNRYESAVKTIQDSYDVSKNKAKFLARQETSLLMTKFKETRYVDAGVEWYQWGCVSGSKNHPVRPWHKALEGKRFRWDDPPITTKAGEPIRRNNPGQDYNCRCFAKPLVSFKEGKT